MTLKNYNALSNKVQATVRCVDTRLEREAVKDWNGYNTDKLREVQKHMDIVRALVEELQIEEEVEVTE